MTTDSNSSYGEALAHTVFGAGLIGGYLGAALMANGAQVTWVVRDRVKAKLANGLRLTDYEGHDEQLKALQFFDSANHAAADFLWVTVKCTGLDAAIEDITAHVKPQTVIVSLQNGLGSEDILQAAFPDNKVVRGVFAANVVEPTPGHLHRGTEGGLDLGETPETEKLRHLIKHPVMPFALHQDIEGLVWAKLQLNLNNAVNALSDIPLKAELSDHGYRKVLAAAQKEMLKVVHAKNIELPKLTALPPKVLPYALGLPNWLYLRLAQKMLAIDPEARSSMWCDLDDGRKTEIAFLNEAVVEEGKKLGIDCPVNQKLVAMIRQIEDGHLEKGVASNAILN